MALASIAAQRELLERDIEIWAQVLHRARAAGDIIAADDAERKVNAALDRLSELLAQR